MVKELTASPAGHVEENGSAPADRPRTGNRDKIVDRSASVALAVGLTLLAEVSARREWVSDLVIPAPSDVLRALLDGLFTSQVYVEHSLSTLYATGAGFLLASASAIALAGMLSSIPRLERILMPFIVALQTLPKTALAPLIILWMGFGQAGKVTIVALVSFFPIVVNALQGMHLRDRDQFELLSSLGSSRWQLLRYVRIPNAVPYVFAGLHIGIVFALIGAVVAELIGSRTGLGYILLQERALFNVPGVFAILFLLLVIGQALHRIMVVTERRVAFWAADVQAVSP